MVPKKPLVNILWITLKAWEFYHSIWQGFTETEYVVVIYLVFIIYLKCSGIQRFGSLFIEELWVPKLIQKFTQLSIGCTLSCYSLFIKAFL